MTETGLRVEDLTVLKHSAELEIEIIAGDKKFRTSHTLLALGHSIESYAKFFKTVYDIESPNF